MKLMKLRKQLDTTQNEKDLIGTQLVRRNDEIGLLNEKLSIIQMALDRGKFFFVPAKTKTLNNINKK